MEHATKIESARPIPMERSRPTRHTTTQSGKVEPVQLEYFQPNPFQPRLVIDKAQLAPLVDSIKRFGFIGHVEARYDPQVPGGRLQLVFGHRRFSAAELAGLKTIPTRIVERTDDEMREIGYIENITSVSLTYWEEGLFFQRMQRDMGTSLNEMAHLTGKSKGYIQNRLDVLRLPEGSALRAAAQSSDIDMTSAVTMLHLFTGGISADQLDHFVDELKAGRMSTDDLKRMRKARVMGLPMDQVVLDTRSELPMVHTVPLNPDPLHFIPQVEGDVKVMTPVVERSLVDQWERMKEDLPTGPTIESIAGNISREISQAMAQTSQFEVEKNEAVDNQVVTVHDRTVFHPKTGHDYAIETLAQVRMIMPHLEQRARKADFSTLTDDERRELHSHKAMIADLIPV